MSAAEVIEEIKKLSPEEREAVAAFVRDFERQIGGVSEEFKRAADQVFATNAELFRKLAQ